jgi:hypothetical protein
VIFLIVGSQCDITRNGKSDKNKVQDDNKKQYIIKGVVITRRKIVLASIILTGVLALTIFLIMLLVTFGDENRECEYFIFKYIAQI